MNFISVLTYFFLLISEIAHDIEWYFSSDAQLLLAVGLLNKVLIFGRCRTDVFGKENSWMVYTEVPFTM